MAKQLSLKEGFRLLVANRGEIATRIFRAATELGIRTIAIYSHEDRFSVHRFKADEAYQVGEEGKPLDAYLNGSAIIELAKELNIDAIHPGYGFLSENSEFAQSCKDHGIVFCGPQPEVLDIFGDKLSAKEAGLNAGLKIIPGSPGEVKTIEEAKKIAQDIGYPITLKAKSGGGGKGIRKVSSEKELENAFERSRSEALSSFGKAEIYIEKNIQNPRHIEVQIAGDNTGQVVHFYERDCSIQRRHQKVIEMAPAINLPEKTKQDLLEASVKLGNSVNYTGVGTVEFLVDENGDYYFLEVNPRIQVEHTVTEVTTGFDLVQISILLAIGKPLNHPAIKIESQESVQFKGVAIQCRITTEDPTKNFAPDTGRILAYRPAQGFGIRLDEGLGTSGGTVTPFYDSLLVKVTAFANDMRSTQKKMLRALKEFRIRGVKHNIPLLLNVVDHKKFGAGEVNTHFLEEYKEVFNFAQPRDRATKMLNFLANSTINNPHQLANKKFERKEQYQLDIQKEDTSPSIKTAKEILSKEGVKGLQTWVKQKKNLLLTDTTMRDAHQSLFATRLRNYDMAKIANYYKIHAHQFFSLEVWGGATFDASFRFLKEDPWYRLEMLREKIPNTLLQMLLRGDNAVGYTNYPKWVIKDFIRLACEKGIDVFRIFDCLNNIEQMAVAMEEVKKNGGVVEASICYTGNIIDPSKTKYTLKYYTDMAKNLEKQGCDILCIKDMAGLLRPKAAELLIKELKNTVDLPIHLHTHATSGTSEAMCLNAARFGCDIIDGAISSMSGLTSQPSLNAMVAALEFSEFKPDVSLSTLDELGLYWEGVRSLYQAFDPGVRSSTTKVYQHEIPGGQYSNLFDQARKVGVSAEGFNQLTERYREVNQLMGDIIKVTPSSKAVGDFSLLLDRNNLTGEQLLKDRPKLDYPDSVVSFFKGHMGIPYGGFRDEVRSLVLGENAPEPAKVQVAEDDSFELIKKKLSLILERDVRDTEVISYRLYPKVFLDYMDHLTEYGNVSLLPTQPFFYGLDLNEEIKVDLEKGKTLYISITGVSKVDEKGVRSVFFSLNGFPRTIQITDEEFHKKHGIQSNAKADSSNPNQIGAPMPGKIIGIKVKQGDQVKEGDPLIVTEAMKMEYVVTAKTDGVVASIPLPIGSDVKEGDLILTLD
ncbi:pyruvate carboxylase [Bacteriovoracaceae bacterium]|nr:pyruvate carboxylase [Bacteriovoracaceae bacterium]